MNVFKRGSGIQKQEGHLTREYKYMIKLAIITLHWRGMPRHALQLDESSLSWGHAISISLIPYLPSSLQI